jgi:hypothetical protein
MTHAPCRAAIATGIFFSLFALSCGDDGLGTGGTDGASAGTGGAIAGTGGAIAGTGGAVVGTGGAVVGTGGAVRGTGGATPGTGGVGGNRGSGGSSAATGGATTTADAGPQAYDARPDQPSGPDVASGCSLSDNLTFGHDGGNAIYWDVNRLTASTFTITRDYSLRAGRDGAATASCSPSLPACGAADAVSVATINADLADPDVQGLWSLPQNPAPIFGTDPRPADGTVYSIALDDGSKVLVGEQCASPAMSSCRYIPAGLVRLTQDLQKLATAMLADPVCQGL